MKTSNGEPTIDISLVILTFNRTEALRRCLNSTSVINKGELSVEVIVVDDGSEIDNLPVVNQFTDILDVTYFKKINQGVASTRNFGLRKARGKFIGFIADDYTLPESYFHSSMRKCTTLEEVNLGGHGRAIQSVEHR